jgi:predicted metal-dependent phosphoesterase TrpH
MPARQPFTAICQAAARSRLADRADLHVHTTQSDGRYTPHQVVELARRSGLAAIAITDHDTLAGVAEARLAAARSSLEVIAGVEISAVFRERELHLLGYFVALDDPALTTTLERLCSHRANRYHDMVERLRWLGVELSEEELTASCLWGSLGRRHLAEVLVESGKVGSVHEAFVRYLADGGRVALPKVRLPVREAIALVRSAGGVASWAHPPYDCTEEQLVELRAHGLQALEAFYPGYRTGHVRQLRACAASLGLAVTAGSDCHGPDDRRREIGTCTVTRAELDTLRRLASG